MSKPSYGTNHTIIYDDEIYGLLLHCINSIEKVKNFKNKSKSYELDIIFYNNNNLYVAHDEPELKQNIKLKDYFVAFNNLDNHKFWLDIKNMDSKNYLSILTI